MLLGIIIFEKLFLRPTQSEFPSILAASKIAPEIAASLLYNTSTSLLSKMFRPGKNKRERSWRTAVCPLKVGLKIN